MTLFQKNRIFSNTFFGKKAENLSKEKIKEERKKLKGPIRLMEVRSGVLDCETLMIDKFTELEGRATEPVATRVTTATNMVADFRQVVNYAKTAMTKKSNADIHNAKTEISTFISTYEHV